jgi:general secretion pathway protein G
MINKSGFTLVEILIVVVILGILAAIVVPQLSNSSTQVKTSALSTDLRKIRTQIELYKFHHKSMLPASSDETNEDFKQRMTEKTDADGNSGTDYGPYMREIPLNPFNNRRTIRIDGPAAGANTEGWRFDTSSGDFQADDSVAHATF